MPETSSLTGLPWPAGPDFNSTIPVTFRQTDAWLAMGMVTVPCANVAERDKRFPAPGLNQRVNVQLNNGELHKWDGRQWQIFDASPQAGAFSMYAVDPANPATLNPMTVDPDGSGDGGGQVWWQRDGHHVDWQITTVFGSDSNLGWTNGWFVWALPFGSRWTVLGGKNIGPSLARGVAQIGSKTYPLSVYWIGAAQVVAVDGTGTRVGRSNWTISGGDYITFGGRSRIGGLL